MSAPPEKALLITSANAKQPLIDVAVQACRSGRLREGRAGPRRVIVGDVNPMAPSVLLAEHPWVMPRLGEIDDRAFVDLLRERDVDVVVPTRDAELLWFAERREALARHGVRVMVSPPTTVRMCQDKIAFAEACADAGIPAIPTAADPAGLPGTATGIVVKERVGAGSRGVVLDVPPETAVDVAAGMAEPIFQPFVSGVEMSVDVYATETGRLLGAVPRVRDLVAHGESQVTTVVDHHDARAVAGAVATAFGIVGHAVVQMIDDGVRLHVVECNPRVGGASTLAFAAGLRTFDWLIAESDGGDLPVQPLGALPSGLRLVRTPKDVIG